MLNLCSVHVNMLSVISSIIKTYVVFFSFSAGVMSLWLRAGTVLAQDPSSGPTSGSSHCLGNPALGNPVTSSGLGRHFIHIHKPRLKTNASPHKNKTLYLFQVTYFYIIFLVSITIELSYSLSSFCYYKTY